MRKRPDVELAIPIAVGDNYKGWRVVGTTPEMFRNFKVLPGGRLFDPTAREALVGSFAERKLRLRPGQEFRPAHGLTFSDQSKEHEEDYVVVGILEPSNTPADRVIWIPLEGLQKMSGHSEKSHFEISAVLLKFKGGSATGIRLDQEITKRKIASPSPGRSAASWPNSSTK